ncbi:MAG: DUF6270 domain-containing protein [Arenimonas sp.]
MFEFSIFGSCVSRDALEFVNSAKVVDYHARQSVISVVSQKPDTQWLELLEVEPTAHEFHQRCIVDDVNKYTFQKIEKCDASDRIWVIDFIEERVPVGLTPCGNFVTVSQAATSFSNINKLPLQRIVAYSPEHIALFEKAIKQFAQILSGKRVVLHKAFYATIAKDAIGISSSANVVLEYFYDLASKHMPQAMLLEVESSFVNASETHKWGLAPYHYQDDYYLRFVEKLSMLIGRSDLSAKPSFSLQKESQ